MTREGAGEKQVLLRYFFLRSPIAQLVPLPGVTRYCPRVPPMGLGKQLRGFRRKTARRKGAEYEACQANHHRFGLTCRAVAGRWSSFQGFLAALKEV